MEGKSSHILLLQVPDGGLRKFKLTKPAYAIGRAAKADICIDNCACSRHHATLLRVETERGIYYQIVDGNPHKERRSANGIFINNERIASRLLAHKDRILLGSQQIVATYLCVSRARIARGELQTITVEHSLGSVSSSRVVAVAPDGEAVLLRDRDAA